LTGNIGSGKSTVGTILRQLGCPVVDADREAHRSYKAGSPVWQQLIDEFGARVLGADGEIDRRALGAIVFSQPSALARLNAIVHPATHKRVEQRLAEFRQECFSWAVLEATLLIESGWHDTVSRLWVVAAPVDLVVARLSESRNMSESEIRARIEAQMPDRRKMALADDIIYNDGSFDDLRRRVERLWQGLSVEAEHTGP